ncbi:MAG: glutamate--tRNA ligase [Burkholderiaceae bacterium]
MAWLGLDPDEGPFFRPGGWTATARSSVRCWPRARPTHCYTSPDELEQMRESQRARGLKPRYDGRWRPENAVGKTPPAGVQPVVRFRNRTPAPCNGTTWSRGPIRIANAELDDLVIARADGSPTYNFCVVVDDADMRITHVIRGDDHVNNTPRQINILTALGVPLPQYGHVPMIHGPDGQKLSKRHGAVSVTQYDDDGYLPEAMVNYLSRLGWSHGDDELFGRDQLVAWFDGSHLSQSPSQFDLEKLNWINQHYLKASGDEALAALVLPRLNRRLAATGRLEPGLDATLSLPTLCALMKERAITLEGLAADLLMFYQQPALDEPAVADDLRARLKPQVISALQAFAAGIGGFAWTPGGIAEAVKGTVAEQGVKMGQFGPPVRLLVFGRAQTPSLEQVLAQLPPELVARRLVDGLAIIESASA